MKIYIAHSCGYNFKKLLYKPIKKSPLSLSNTFIYPHENDKYINSKDIIKNSNLVMAEVSYCGTGLGIELGWADSFNIPIICLHKNDVKPALSLKTVTNNIFKYSNIENMLDIIRKELLN